MEAHRAPPPVAANLDVAASCGTRCNATRRLRRYRLRTLLSIAVAAAAGFALAACDRQPRAPALGPATLDPVQAESLKAMNEAGATPFAGWTWRYEFGSNCMLRVKRAYEGQVQSPMDHAMRDRTIDVVAYATEGFGVKAYGPKPGDSADLFDVRSDRDARAFVEHARNLIAPCAGAAAASPAAGG